MDITNVVKTSRAYDTNRDLSDKERKEKNPTESRDYIMFGEAIAGGIEAHDFSLGTSLKTTTPGDTKKTGDNGSKGEQTL